ncbi:MAG: PAS domain S-box protein [Desulfotignum sp.]
MEHSDIKKGLSMAEKPTYEELKRRVQELEKIESEVEVIKADKQRLEMILSSLDTGLSLINPDYTISWVNDTIRSIFPHGDPVGKTCHRFFESSEHMCNPCPTFEAYKSGRTRKMDKYNPSKDKWYSIISQPVKDEAGQIVSVLEAITEITERKNYEQQILKEKNLLQQVMETSPVGITMVDEKGNISMANARAEEILGLERSDIYKRRYNDQEWQIADFQGNAYPDDQLPFELVKKTGNPVFGIKHSLVWPGGKKVLLSINAKPLFDSDGDFNGMISAIEDVTERRKAEETLRKKTQLLEQISDNMFDMVSMSDLEGTYTFVGKSHERILGYTTEELIGKNVMDFVHPDDLPEIAGELQNLLETGGFKKAQYRYKHKENHYLWFETIGELLLHENQAPKKILFSTRDITDRKCSEDELKLTLDATTDGIWTWNFKTNKLFFSPKYYTMLGYEPDAFPASFENWIDLIHPDDKEGAIVTAKEYLKTKPDFYENEFRVRTKEGGYRWLHTSAKVVERDVNGNAVYMIGNHEDITERKKAEEERIKLEKHLHQAQKMESIGSLAGGIAHDFNNLLFPIVGLSEMMLNDFPPDSMERQNIQEIFNAGTRGRELVQQILSFSRQSEYQKIPVHIQKILKEVLKLCRATIPADITITKDIQADCGPVMADPTQIHQIAMNLITNAYHAVEPTGGTITVKIKEVDFNHDDNPAFQLVSGRYAVLSVNDTGTGIEPAVINKIFDPYFTTKEKGRGTGLGLATVYGIVKAHGGDIKVHSEVGKGSSFNVYLPLLEKAQDAEPEKEMTPLPTGTEHILLVDDEKPIVHLEQQMLERLGYRVTSFTSSVDALAAFRTDPSCFDLIITDMNMPHMNGMQLAKELIAITPDIPIIICTGFSERINKENAAVMGIKGLLMKPVVMADMAKEVRRVLDKD